MTNRVSVVTQNTWIFNFRHEKKMNDETLDRYHQKLLELKSKYQDDHLLKQSFLKHGNVFAKFATSPCLKHGDQRHWWHLLCNPNLKGEEENSFAWSILDNECVEKEFKVKSKEIQNELVKEFPEFFQLKDGQVNRSEEGSNKTRSSSFYEEPFDHHSDECDQSDDSSLFYQTNTLDE